MTCVREYARKNREDGGHTVDGTEAAEGGGKQGRAGGSGMAKGGLGNGSDFTSCGVIAYALTCTDLTSKLQALLRRDELPLSTLMAGKRIAQQEGIVQREARVLGEG